ncbi:MFS transporter [Pollutimonas sp. H1-120]|uniref:MFS transporter n=1 Tax=Pollutimonas sp. H1-120 TaxID=3148824 RepID=UPI003B520CDB
MCEKQEKAVALGRIGNWYFGWTIVAAAATLTLLTVGLRMGIGPFFLPIAHDLGFSRSLLAGIIAIGMLFYGIGMPIAGHLVSTRGTRFVLLLGTALVAVAIAGTVMATGPISFLLAFGVLLSLGLSFISPVTMTPVLSRWFVRRRGMALFFLSTGSMAGIAILTPVLGLSIEWLGWRETLLSFAVLLAVITVPIALFIIREDAPPDADAGPATPGAPSAAATADSSALAAANCASPAPGRAAMRPSPAVDLKVRDALRTVQFWKIAFGLFACGYSMNLLGTHGVPMLMDHGFDAMTGSFGIGLIGFAAIFSTLVLGRLSDMVPRRNILSAIYLIRGLGFFALVMVGTQWELYAAATIGGIVWAGSIALSSAILADLYGVRLVGILYGWTYLGHQVGGMISSWLGGWGYETFGTHWIAFGSAGALLLAASIVSMSLPASRQAFVVPVAAR